MEVLILLFYFIENFFPESLDVVAHPTGAFLLFRSLHLPFVHLTTLSMTMLPVNGGGLT